jgi:hypothetical protein
VTHQSRPVLRFVVAALTLIVCSSAHSQTKLDIYRAKLANAASCTEIRSIIDDGNREDLHDPDIEAAARRRLDCDVAPRPAVVHLPKPPVTHAVPPAAVHVSKPPVMHATPNADPCCRPPPLPPVVNAADSQDPLAGAMFYLNKRQYDDAVQELTRVIDNGNMKSRGMAEYTLATLYLPGNLYRPEEPHQYPGSPIKEAAGMDLLERAANDRNRFAEYAMGLVEKNRGNIEKAKDWLRRAMEDGEPRAGPDLDQLDH